MQRLPCRTETCMIFQSPARFAMLGGRYVVQLCPARSGGSLVCMGHFRAHCPDAGPHPMRRPLICLKMIMVAMSNVYFRLWPNGKFGSTSQCVTHLCRATSQPNALANYNFGNACDP